MALRVRRKAARKAPGGLHEEARALGITLRKIRGGWRTRHTRSGITRDWTNPDHVRSYLRGWAQRSAMR